MKILVTGGAGFIGSPGDPDSLVANSNKLVVTTDWLPKHDNLKMICDTALGWEKRLSEMKRQNQPKDI